ncbi:hypothetical protein Nepgr_021098 [Nepenthes gracilis]|uniref:Uncharacterized protein n=1 Tax=Nepenthes gracilis TaxID=150966 RepID=A0AAD3XVN3_NEPGR|nr:hypothetical protein Nepgr_021098 [Nepenthes gracilis]
MDRLHYAHVCVDVKLDAVLLAKIFLSKRSTPKAESVVEIEVESPNISKRFKPSARTVVYAQGGMLPSSDPGKPASSEGDFRESVEGCQLTNSLMPSSLSPANGDGQKKGDVEQVLPVAEPLYDSLLLPISMLPEIEICDPVSRPIVAAAADSSDELKACLGQLDPAPCVLSVNSESQSLGVTCRESPELLVSLHLPDSTATSFVKDLLHLEGQHIPICAG